MTYERDYKKIILYIFGCFGLVFGTLFLSFIFLLGKVSALDTAYFNLNDMGCDSIENPYCVFNFNPTNNSLIGIRKVFNEVNPQTTTPIINLGRNNLLYITVWYEPVNRDSTTSNVTGTVSGAYNYSGDIFTDISGYSYDCDTYYQGICDSWSSNSPSQDGTYSGSGTSNNNVSLNVPNNSQPMVGFVLSIIANGRTHSPYQIINNGNYITFVYKIESDNLLMTGFEIYFYSNTNEQFRLLIRRRMDLFTDDNQKQYVAQQETNEKLDEVNDNLTSTDTSGSDEGQESFANNSSFQDHYGLTDIINLPLSLLNHLTDSCSSISLPLPYFNENIVINCPTYFYNKMLGNDLVTLISTFINGFVIYRFLMVIVNSINNAKNPDNDKLEMIDL